MFSRIHEFRRPSNAEPVTESEIHDLRVAADALRKQLTQLVDHEISPNNEACGVATHGMVLLRNETDEKRTARDDLQNGLDEARGELKRVEDACVREREEKERCRGQIETLKEDAVNTREKEVKLRAEMEQMAFFQEDVDMETMHRLRADVQNLETEKERDQIYLRQLNNQGKVLRAELEELTLLRDKHRISASERQQEAEEAKMTQDMYRAHQESLAAHLEEVGGDPGFLFGKFAMGSLGLSIRIGDMFGEKLRSEIAGAANEGSAQSRPALCESNIPGERTATIRKLETNQRQQQFEKPKQVGGIIFGAENTAESPSEFLRKLPTIFKMGSNASGASEDYMVRNEREVEFYTDSNSISGISAITMDDMDMWLSMTDTEEPQGAEG